MRILGVLLLFGFSESQVPPSWPNIFQEDFTEVLSYPLLGSGNTTGTIYYDWTMQRYALKRQNGNWDRYCGTVYMFTDTPCTHIVSNGLRYLHFPDQKYCCMCCSGVNGCGVLRPDWTAGAVFVEEYMDEKGRLVEVFNKKGLQDNLVHFLKDSSVMVRIVQVPNDDQKFVPESFSLTVDPKVFELPGICTPDKKCPFYSTCHFIGTDKFSAAAA